MRIYIEKEIYNETFFGKAESNDFYALQAGFS